MNMICLRIGSFIVPLVRPNLCSEFVAPLYAGLCGTYSISSLLRELFLLSPLMLCIKFRCTCRCGNLWLGDKINKRWSWRLARFVRSISLSETLLPRSSRCSCLYPFFFLLFVGVWVSWWFSSDLDFVLIWMVDPCVCCKTACLYSAVGSSFINLKLGSARAFHVMNKMNAN
jgi:hypothetical protein